MVGNAIEEGLMGQVKNPSHTAPGRFATLAGLPCGIVTFMATRGVVPNFLAILLALFVCALVAGVTYRWVSRVDRERQAKQMEEYRATLDAEAQRQIRDMKAGR